MAYEDSAGLNVNNHYGPRTTGGTEGVTNTSGVYNEYVKDLDETGLAFGFPSPATGKPSVWVVLADDAEAEGTVTAITVGGVNVTAATEAAPVEIPAGNSGVVVATGATGGNIMIKFRRYPRV